MIMGDSPRYRAMEREAISTLRQLVGEFWGRVAAAPTAEQAQRVPYPDWGAYSQTYARQVALGWTMAREGMVALLARRLPAVAERIERDLRRHSPAQLAAAQPATAAEAAVDVILRRIYTRVTPTGAIADYVRRRVLPIRWAVEEADRARVLAVIAAIAEQGGAWQDVQEAMRRGWGLSERHAENVARTELSTCFNAGTVLQYHDSAIVSGVRFEAAMDDRTTAICEHWNGRVFTLEAAAVALTPPLHYQCRSTLAPTFAWEGIPENFALAWAAARPEQRPLPGFGSSDVPDAPRTSFRELFVTNRELNAQPAIVRSIVEALDQSGAEPLPIEGVG